MISHEDAELRITTWLLTTPEANATEILTDTFDVTRRTSQVSALRRRLPPARFAWLGAAGAAVAAVLLFAVAAPFAVPRTGDAHLAGFTSVVQPRWPANGGDVEATVQHQAGDRGSYYWRAAVYDEITPVGYMTGPGQETVHPPQTPVLQGTGDDIDAQGMRQVTFTVQPGAHDSPYVLSPVAPYHVDQSTRLTTVGKNGYFANLQRDDSGPYSVTALIPAGPEGSPGGGAILSGGNPIQPSPDPGYPVDLVNTYTKLPPQTIGPNLSALRDQVVQTAASEAPYDVANRIVEVLQSGRFAYDTDVTDFVCGSMSVAECFATSNRGYCVHFALTMAVLLRDLGIPARIVEGYLPGQVDQASGTEVIYQSQAHAWVEVYFIGAGWVAFDPSPGGARP
jgi:hypothetical protein